VAGCGVQVNMVVTDSASNMRKAFSVLKEFEPDDEVSDELDPGLDDDTIWEDMDDSDTAEVTNVIQRRNLERLSCSAHSLQLVVKDGLAKAKAPRQVRVDKNYEFLKRRQCVSSTK
jgi:hypothetical protein